MKPFYTTSVALIAYLTSFAEAGPYEGHAIQIAPEVPPPANTVCNVVGKVGPIAQLHLIQQFKTSFVSVCAQYCVSQVPGCKFATQEKNGQTNEDALCSLYNADAATLGFTANAKADTIGFAQKCYFQPATASFRLQCPTDDPNCGGKFLAATSDASDAARFPTAFVAKRTAGTIFTISNQRADVTMAQGGKKYPGSLPSADPPVGKPSVISFSTQVGKNSTGFTPMSCIQSRQQFFNEPATFNLACFQSPVEPDGYHKDSFFACLDKKKGRKTLRLAEDPYYNGLDGCYDTDVTFRLVDYVAHH